MMAETNKKSRPKLGSGAWWKDLAKRLSLLSCTLLVLVVVGEISIRLLTSTIPPLTVKDGAIGQHYIRDFEADVFVPEADREVHLRFNDDGFRGRDFSIEKPAGIRRVAFLGDSMIASLAVDESDTMVSCLEKSLNGSDSASNWEVMNFGVSGSSPGQQLALYRELASKYDPDVVFCSFFVGNDLADGCCRLSNNPRIYFDLNEEGELYQIPFSAKRAAVSRFLNRYSRLYVWQKDTINRARRSVCDKVGVLEPGHWVYCQKPNEDQTHAWNICERVLVQFKEEVESNGAKFAVVVIPHSAQVYKDHFEVVASLAGDEGESFSQDYPDERIRDICSRNNVSCVVMTEAFRNAAPTASTEADEEWLFCRGVGHFNERGNSLAAEEVYSFMTEQESISVAEKPSSGAIH